MAGVPAKPQTFFRVSPAEPGEAQCFAVRRGEIPGRADAIFHRPWIQDQLASLGKSDFTVTRLGNVAAEILHGMSSPPPYLEESNQTVPFVRATDIKDGEINSDTLLHISKDQPDRFAKCRLSGGELIIVRSGANTGDCAVVPELLAGSYAAYDLILKFHADISTKFVATFLDSDIGRLQLNLVKGRSAQPHVNTEEVAAVQILLPPLDFQNELVAAMEAARAERKGKLSEADALLGGVDDFLLNTLGVSLPSGDSRQVFAVSKQSVDKRLDPYFHIPRFARIQDALSDIHSESLGDFAVFSKEIWRPENHDDPTFRYIEINSVNPRTGEAHFNEVATDRAPSRARMKVQMDDIIVSLTRPHHGSIAHLGAEFEGCVASTGFAVIRKVAPHVRRDYLWCVLRAQFSLDQMIQRASGGNYPAITETELGNITIPVPSMQMQEAIANEVGHRHQQARRLHVEAESGWQEAKQWFEAKLIGRRVE